MRGYQSAAGRRGQQWSYDHHAGSLWHEGLLCNPHGLCSSWKQPHQKLEDEVLPGCKDLTEVERMFEPNTELGAALPTLVFSTWLGVSSPAWVPCGPHTSARVVQIHRRKELKQRQRKNVYQKASYFTNRSKVQIHIFSWPPRNNNSALNCI